MFNIDFYEKSNGESDVWDFLEELRIKSQTNKDARIQHKQIALYIQLLQDNGTQLPESITKHIEEGIWELRPGNNRVLYFFLEKDLLFYFTILERKHRKRQDMKLIKLN